jgi:hypothetical protein
MWLLQLPTGCDMLSGEEITQQARFKPRIGGR